MARPTMFGRSRDSDPRPVGRAKKPGRRLRWGLWLLAPLLMLATCVVVISKIDELGQVRLAPRQILHIKLQPEWSEGPSSPLAGLLGRGSTSLHEVRQTLAAAADDPRIVGVFIDGAAIGSGLGGVSEFRRTLSAFSSSGKATASVWPIDRVGEKELLLASATDHVTLPPHTAVAFDGLVGEVGFYRGLFDKLKVRPEFFQYKEYKSAAEPFVRTEMSAAMREALDAVLANLWHQTLTTVAHARKIDVEGLRQFADRGMTGASKAQAQGLVDSVGYPDQAIAQLRAAIDPEQKPGAETDPIPMVSLAQYQKVLAAESSAMAERTKIAIIYGEGPIVTVAEGGLGSSGFSGQTMAASIRQAAADETVRGIVLRIDSPGGAVVGSDLVWREVERVRSERDKPVVVSMASTAASGGYWVAMAANEIVAEASTITGSIGVLFGKFDLSGLSEWAGVHHDRVVHGRHADLDSSFKSLEDPERRAIITRWLDDTYQSFVRKVARGRNRDFDTIEKVARGRIWTGEQALAHGLVDHLGGVDLAVERCRDLAELPADAQVDVVAFPKAPTLLESLQQLGGDKSPPHLQNLAQKISSAGPERQLIERALGVREMRFWAELEQAGVWAIGPALKIK